jgi:hypothetical protein
MRNLLFATTILSGLSLALPAAAQNVGIGADAGVSGGIGASAGDGGVGVGAGADAGVSGGIGASAGDGGVGVGIGADADAAVSAGLNADGNVGATVGATLGGTVAGPAAVSGQALASVDAGLVIGAPIVSADGRIIGTVADITTDTTGKVMVTVDLAGELDLSIGSIRIGAEHAAFVDGQVRLNMAQASLVAALEAQLAASVETDADAGATLGAQAGIGTTASGAQAGIGTTGSGAQAAIGTTAPDAQAAIGTTAPDAQAGIGTAAPGAQGVVGTAALVAPGPGTAGADAIGRLAGMRAGDLRATLAELGSDDVRTLKLSCADVLANPAAYSADTRAVCEVIASI